MSSDSSAGVLIRRGTELISAQLRYRGAPQSSIKGWLVPLIVILTVLVFVLAIFWVEYTCAQVIATLAAVEDSNPTTYICLDGEGSNNSCEPSDPEDAAKSNTKPITSGLRSAVEHLRARGGIWSSFRGYRMYLAFTGFDIGVGFLLPVIIPIRIYSRSLFGAFFGKFVASMLLATWQMAWVHLVIADKSPRTRYRRMIGPQNWPRIAPAAALYNIIMSATFSLPGSSSSSVGWTVGWTVMAVITNPGHEKLHDAIAMRILPTIMFQLASIPARAVFIRVAASMLPEEDDPIVPFDRLFGGKVNPEITGGSSQLGLMDAWTTFESAARARYIKVILKALAIEVALALVGILLVMGEIVLFL